MQYGVLAVKHRPLNLGDDVQWIASARFLPRIDAFIDREDPTEAADWPETFCIFNGWFTWRPDRYPPPPSVKPFWIALHIASDHMLTARMIEHLKAHEPIGARDLNTLTMLRNAGISSYWSGCLTATLPKSDDSRAGGEVILADLHRKIVGSVPKSIRRGANKVSNKVTKPEDPAARQELSWRLLDRLSKARLVVTSRLHIAIPCSAVGTPCVMLHPTVNTDRRFGGVRGTLFRGYDRFTIDEVDWDAGPLDVDPMRNFLTEVCEAAVRHNDNPFRHESIELPEASLRIGGPVGTGWTS